MMKEALWSEAKRALASAIPSDSPTRVRGYNALGPFILLRSRLVRNARISVEVGDNETWPKTDNQNQIFFINCELRS